MTSTKRYHIIAIGGAAMHNIALDLHAHGNIVTGSDDEIYEPSLSRLKAVGIAPEKFGWYPERIDTDIDTVILGMHAKEDNPELIKAIELGIEVLSYPAFIYRHSTNKIRVVVAGSHGKTTTTAMILHVLKKQKIAFDYLVGAQLHGFDRMVSLSDASLIVIEGDEYLSSPIDRVPKLHHYHPHISVLTGIAWDHVNVFPTYASYKDIFKIYLDKMVPGGEIIYCGIDPEVVDVVESSTASLIKHAYSFLTKGDNFNIKHNKKLYPISVIGNHNLQNMNAALLVCKSLGIKDDDFFVSIADFSGANKRLQVLHKDDKRTVFLDFAHAPSKVKATTDSVKAWFGNQHLLAVLELHTFSSLNESFIPQYRDSLNLADSGIVFYNEHTLRMKNMPSLSKEFIQEQFGHKDLVVFTSREELSAYLERDRFDKSNILLMSSGTFDGLNINDLFVT